MSNYEDSVNAQEMAKILSSANSNSMGGVQPFGMSGVKIPAGRLTPIGTLHYEIDEPVSQMTMAEKIKTLISRSSMESDVVINILAQIGVEGYMLRCTNSMMTESEIVEHFSAILHKKAFGR